jgi:hypothetical protein
VISGRPAAISLFFISFRISFRDHDDDQRQGQVVEGEGKAKEGQRRRLNFKFLDMDSEHPWQVGEGVEGMRLMKNVT